MDFSRTFRSLRNRNYRIWAAGAAVSNIGTWMQRTAQDWLVLTELTHHNAAAVGVVMGLQSAPQLLLLPWTGYAADRLDRRKLLLITQAVMGVLALALGLLVVGGVARLWQVDVFAFVFGCANAFDAPARHSFVSELAGETDLLNAVALNSTSFNAGRMIGPAVAGLCIGVLGSGWAFVLNGLSFLGVLISLLFLRVADLHRNARAKPARGGFIEGARYVWRRPDLRAIVVILALIGTFGLNFPIFISTMAVGVFHVGAGRYGLLTTLMAVGTLAGALAAASQERADFRSLLTGAGAFALGCALAALAPDYAVFGAMLMLVGVATLMLTTTTNTLMQLTSAPEMRGRVMAIRLAVALGGTPVGAPMVGWVANHFGPRWALGVAALSGLAAALVAARYLAFRRNQVSGVS